jgi:hypothetical protein
MFPPPPAYNRGAQRGSSSIFYEHNDNEKNVAVNAATTKPETNTSSQADEEAEGAPKSSKNRRSCNAALTFLVICLTVFGIWALGGIGTRINTYCLRDKEAAFRTDCAAGGGGLENLDYPNVTFWRTGRMVCRHYGDEGKDMSFEMNGGRVVVWR